MGDSGASSSATASPAAASTESHSGTTTSPQTVDVASASEEAPSSYPDPATEAGSDFAEAASEHTSTYVYDTLPEGVNEVRRVVQDIIAYYALATPALRLLEPQLVGACYCDSPSSTAVTGVYDIGMPSVLIMPELSKSFAAAWFSGCSLAAEEVPQGECPRVNLCMLEKSVGERWGTRSEQLGNRPPDATMRNHCVSRVHRDKRGGQRRRHARRPPRSKCPTLVDTPCGACRSYFWSHAARTPCRRSRASARAGRCRGASSPSQ